MTADPTSRKCQEVLSALHNGNINTHEAVDQITFLLQNRPKPEPESEPKQLRIVTHPQRERSGGKLLRTIAFKVVEIGGEYPRDSQVVSVTVPQALELAGKLLEEVHSVCRSAEVSDLLRREPV